MYSRFPFCSDLKARTSCSQPLVECERASKYEENFKSSSSFNEMQGLYRRRSEDNVVNGYGRCLLKMYAGFQFVVLNGMCNGDPKGSRMFVSPHCNSTRFYRLFHCI